MYPKTKIEILEIPMMINLDPESVTGSSQNPSQDTIMTTAVGIADLK